MKRYCYRSIHLMNNPPDVFMIWCFSVSVFFYPLITQTYTINFDCHAWQGFRAFLVFTGTNLSSMAQHTHYTERLGRLRGLAVACCTTDPYHPCSNPGVGISEGCFVFHFVSLPLEVARPIQPTLCTKVAVKHQSSSYTETLNAFCCSHSSETDSTPGGHMEKKKQQSVDNRLETKSHYVYRLTL